jgi:hypothetical protein
VREYERKRQSEREREREREKDQIFLKENKKIENARNLKDLYRR